MTVSLCRPVDVRAKHCPRSVERSQRRPLVGGHEKRIACRVSGQDRGQALARLRLLHCHAANLPGRRRFLRKLRAFSSKQRTNQQPEADSSFHQQRRCCTRVPIPHPSQRPPCPSSICSPRRTSQIRYSPRALDRHFPKRTCRERHPRACARIRGTLHRVCGAHGGVRPRPRDAAHASDG